MILLRCLFLNHFYFFKIVSYQSTFLNVSFPVQIKFKYFFIPFPSSSANGEPINYDGIAKISKTGIAYFATI
jgi:hypothetical protein